MLMVIFEYEFYIVAKDQMNPFFDSLTLWRIVLQLSDVLMYHILWVSLFVSMGDSRLVEIV
jgi:hypothetical protein